MYVIEALMSGLRQLSTIQWAGVAGLFHLAFFCMVTAHCLGSRRDSRSVIIWIFSAWAFPFIGALGYAAFGVSRVSRKEWRKRGADSRFGVAVTGNGQESRPMAYWRSLCEARACRPPSAAERFDAALDRITPNHALLSGNAVRLLEDGTEAFPAMLDAIRASRHHIHIMSYIIGADDVGREMLDACAERARAGVKVRVMYDAFGSMPARLRRFFPRYARVPNMRIVKFSLANIFKQQVQINLRNHRKCLVVDGRVAFTGGVNLHAGHIGSNGGEQPIRDYHFEITGPLASELQYTFLRDWFRMTEENPEELLSAAYFVSQSPAGNVAARLVNCGPTSMDHSVEEVFFNAIIEAHKSVSIITPYCVLTEPLLYAIRMAAMRGAHIRLILPARNNHVSVYYASRGQYAELLEAGVRIFERRGALLHAKAMVVDEYFSVFGSANMDVRSLRLNFETVVVSYDPELTNRLLLEMGKDLAASTEILLPDWSRRRRLDRLLENIFAIATPIL